MIVAGITGIWNIIQTCLGLILCCPCAICWMMSGAVNKDNNTVRVNSSVRAEMV